MFNILFFSEFRFIDSSGHFFRPEHFVPLGHGRRMCMGEPLAKAELFIFFVSLVQKLQFSGVDGREPDPEKYSAGLTRAPAEFIVRVRQRNDCDLP